MRMTRIPIVSVMVLLPMVVLGTMLAVFVHADTSTARPGPPPVIHHKPPQGVVYYPNVTPDIIPRTKGTPAFSVADVRQYVLTHPFPGGPTVSHKPPTIVSIQLLTSQQASAQLGGEYIGLPDTALVYLVQLRGPFLMVNIKGLQGGAGISPVGLEVFDAQKGFRLLWGA